MRRCKGQKGFSFGIRGSERAPSETPCASLTPVGLSSVCLSVNGFRRVVSGVGGMLRMTREAADAAVQRVKRFYFRDEG